MEGKKQIEKNTIKFPSEKVVEGILKEWSDDHSRAWDYDADKRAVNKALKAYAKKVLALNNLTTKDVVLKFPIF